MDKSRESFDNEDDFNNRDEEANMNDDLEMVKFNIKLKTNKGTIKQNQELIAL
jgi:hypothetical protein